MKGRILEWRWHYEW